MPRIDGGTGGDLTIADHRVEARQLRTQASVVAVLPPGRRARGASIPPHSSPVWKGGAVHPATEDEEWRGLRSQRAQAAGPGHRDDRSRSERWHDPAVPGRRSTSAGTSPRARVSGAVICVICVICGQCARERRSLCLRVFVFAMCLGGRQIRNPKSEILPRGWVAQPSSSSRR